MTAISRNMLENHLQTDLNKDEHSKEGTVEANTHLLTLVTVGFAAGGESTTMLSTLSSLVLCLCGLGNTNPLLHNNSNTVTDKTLLKLLNWVKIHEISKREFSNKTNLFVACF